MAHFYGTLQGARGEATRCGNRSSGVRTVAASWRGAIQVDVFHNAETGSDEFSVRMRPWHGAGCDREIARGLIGDATTVECNAVHKRA